MVGEPLDTLQPSCICMNCHWQECGWGLIMDCWTLMLDRQKQGGCVVGAVWWLTMPHLWCWHHQPGSPQAAGSLGRGLQLTQPCEGGWTSAHCETAPPLRHGEGQPSTACPYTCKGWCSVFNNFLAHETDQRQSMIMKRKCLKYNV